MTILEGLKHTYAQTLPFFELDDASLEKTYGADKWSIRFILHHLADAETVLYDRIRRAISKPGQVVWGFDQEAWATGLDYPSRPLALSKSIYSAVRSNIIHLTDAYYEEHGANQVVHNEAGMKTLKDIIDKVVWHNEGHIKHIEQALSGN